MTQRSVRMFGTMTEIARTLYAIPEWRAALEKARRGYEKSQRVERKRGGQPIDYDFLLAIAAVIRRSVRSDRAALDRAARLFYPDSVNAVRRRLTEKLRKVGIRGHRLEKIEIPPGAGVTGPTRDHWPTKVSGTFTTAEIFGHREQRSAGSKTKPVRSSRR
jgi:hypothetical protein